MHLKCYDAVKHSFASFLFCMSFANRASVFVDIYIYIDFDWNHSIFPVACLVCQVDAMIIFFPSGVPYAVHVVPCIPCHVLHHVARALHRESMIDFCSIACVLALGRAGRRVRE